QRPRRLEALRQGLPARLGVPPRVHDHQAAAGGDQVGERVTERAVRYRHGYRPQVRADLLDRRGGTRPPRPPPPPPRPPHPVSPPARASDPPPAPLARPPPR